MPWRAFARHAGWRVAGGVRWGAQEWTMGDARIFVTPNPSPATASHSLAVLGESFDELADVLAPGRDAGCGPT